MYWKWYIKGNPFQHSEHHWHWLFFNINIKPTLFLVLQQNKKIYSLLLRSLFFARLVLYTLFIWIKATSLIFQCQWQFSSKQLGRSVLRRAMHRYLICDELQNAVWLRIVWSTGPNMGPPRSGRKSLFCGDFFFTLDYASNSKRWNVDFTGSLH